MTEDATFLLVAQLGAEAAYWRARAERVENALRVVSIDAADAYRSIAGGVPPEPPVGTELRRAGRVLWVHRADGWHCSRPIGACGACPAPWAETWERDGRIDGVTRHLPLTAAPHDPAPVTSP